MAGPQGRAATLSQRPFPYIRKILVDAGCQSLSIAEATSIAAEILKRKPDHAGFAVQPRCWVVEPFFAWISRNRRPWMEVEAAIESATTFLYMAAVMILA